jgi:hypothetical protein
MAKKPTARRRFRREGKSKLKGSRVKSSEFEVQRSKVKVQKLKVHGRSAGRRAVSLAGAHFLSKKL